MRTILRLIFLNILIGYIIAIFRPVSIKTSSEFLTCGEQVLFVWVMASVLAIFFFWGVMFYNWGINDFCDSTSKRIWFWVLSLGGLFYFIGPMIYYVLVFEYGTHLTKGTPRGRP